MDGNDGIPSSLFAPPQVCAGVAGTPGTLVLRSAKPLGGYPLSVVHSVREHARQAPDSPMIAERAGDHWHTVTYGQAVAAAGAIGQALLDRGLGPGRPLLILSGIAEDFKLESGTFVRVGAVRTALLSAIPVLANAVLAGENRDCVCALAWLNPAEARALLGEQPEPDGELITHAGLRAHLARALAGHNDAAGSSARIRRLVVMACPPSLDDGEITDKGYVNQRKVLARRAALVDMLYADPSPTGVIIVDRTA